MGSAQLTPITAATDYNRGACSENRISVSDLSSSGEVKPHAPVPLDVSPDNPATQLLDTMREIDKRAGEITAHFVAITTALKDVSDPRRNRCFLSFRRNDLSKMKPLQCQWAEIYQLHKKTMWGSRDVAAIIAAKFKSFVEVFIPYLQSDRDLDEKKAEIAAYREANKMQVNVEHQFHDEFQEICNKLKKFKKELSSAASEIFNELERGIEVLQTEIKSFGDQIDKALINFDAVHGGVVDPSTQSDLLRQITDKKTATALSSIWGMVDLTWLGTRLGDPGTTVESQNLFSRHLESIEMCYRCLHCALYEFATALDIDKAPASTLEFHKRTTSASHQLEK